MELTVGLRETICYLQYPVNVERDSGVSQDYIYIPINEWTQRWVTYQATLFFVDEQFIK